MSEYISKTTAIEELEEEIGTIDKPDARDALINMGLKIALRDIKRLPAADVQPVKHGRWEEITDYERDKMLRDTVAELCEAKRLLKAAVEALNDGSCNKDCRQCENHKSCDYDNRFKWKHTNEVLKLIGEGGDEECQ